MSDSFHSSVQRLGSPSGRGATGFLIVCLDAFRHVVVDDVADVRLIDAHAERIGSDDYRHGVGDEVALRLVAYVGRHAAVVGDRDGAIVHDGVCRNRRRRSAQRRHGVVEGRGECLRLLARGAVDDAGFVRLRPATQPCDPCRLVLGLRSGCTSKYRFGRSKPGDGDPRRACAVPRMPFDVAAARARVAVAVNAATAGRAGRAGDELARCRRYDWGGNPAPIGRRSGLRRRRHSEIGTLRRRQLRNRSDRPAVPGRHRASLDVAPPAACASTHGLHHRGPARVLFRYAAGNARRR